MRILAIDVGGSHVKLLRSDETTERRFVSGPSMGPAQMIGGIKPLVADWPYDVATIGFPGPVAHNSVVGEPHNLAPGWVGFDFADALGHPVKVMNDAAMQALGSYQGGRMLFLGLGTGLGTTLIVDGAVVALELGHLPYKKGTFEDYVGERGLEKRGKKKWRQHVALMAELLTHATIAEDVVLGGGNVRLLDALPDKCRAGNNENAFRGGFRAWNQTAAPTQSALN